MLEVSASFLATLTGSHRVMAAADVWYDGELVAADLPVSGGTVVWEEGAEVESSIQGLTISDPTGALLPTDPTDPLAPWGQEVVLRRGVAIPGQADELVPLGWFQITSTSSRARWRLVAQGGAAPAWRSGGAELNVAAADRLVVLQRADLLAPTQPAAGATVLGEIERLVAPLLPLKEFPGSVTDRSVPTNIVYEQSRLKAVRDLAAAVGCAVYADRDGDVALRLVADQPTSWTIPAGPGGLLAEADYDLSADQVYNAVVASGEASTDKAPVRAVAIQHSGPTRWDGPFGRRPYFFSSPLLTTKAQAEAAATSRLRTLRAQADQVMRVVCVPNPALEVGDTVTLGTPMGSISGRVVRIELPLLASGGPMQLAVQVPTAALWQLEQAVSGSG